MSIIAVDHTPRHGGALFTRRSFLRAIGSAFARTFYAVASGFTAIADELARLFRVCSLDIALQEA